MKTTKSAVKDIAPCEKIVSVDVERPDILQEYEVVYREIEKVARIPGFRPGKAPRELVSSHYREEAKEEVLKKLVSKSLTQALRERNLDTLAAPEIRDLDFTDEKLRYHAYIQTRPEFTLGSYVGIKVKKEVPPIEDAEVDQVVEKLREGYAKFIPVEERGLEAGDFMIADLKVHVEGKVIESREDDWIEFREKGVGPEFSEALRGARSGDEREVQVTFPADYPKPEVAGKKGLFKVKVKEIKKRELPEVTADWAREVGEYQSVEWLRDAIARDLAEEKMALAEHRVKNEILEALLGSVMFDLPKGIVERRLNGLMEEAVRDMVLRGFKQEDIAKEKEAIRDKLRPEAEKQVRLGFIVEKIAELEKIEVTQPDVDAKFDEIAQKVKQPRDKVVAYYGSEHLVGGLINQILNEKVVRFLREKAEVI